MWNERTIDFNGTVGFVCHGLYIYTMRGLGSGGSVEPGKATIKKYYACAIGDVHLASAVGS